MGRKNRNLFYPIFGIVAFMIVVITFMELPKVFPSEDWSTIQTDFIQIMPWILMLGTGVIVLALVLHSRPNNLYAFTTPIGAFIGIGMAMAIRTLYDLGILLDEVITSTLTITDIQIVCILAWMVMCMIVGIINDR